MLEYKEEDLIGKDIRKLVKKSEHKKLKFFLEQIKSEPDTQIDGFEQHIYTKNRNQILIRWNLTPLKNNDGNIIGILGAGQDITVKKIMVDVLEISEKQLTIKNNINHFFHFINPPI